MRHQTETLDRIAGSAVVERLTALHPKLIDLSTGRIERLLRRLGDPHLGLNRVIHVAGTNGKGSTVAMLRAGLEAAGLSVNVYTSPHLVRFTERVRRGGQEISEDALLSVLERCENANDGAQITFFEILTAAAFLAFADQPADANLIEVGLGGRYDATNVFPAPALSVITPVSIDHVDFLGDELGQIAWEKAGILKHGRPGVIAPQHPTALQTIQATATDVGAALAIGDQDWSIAASGDGLRFQDSWNGQAFKLPRPALQGDWQIVNAGTALAALNRLEGVALTEQVAASALLNAHWPGRLQRLRTGPLVEAAAPRALWLDGGHNPGAGEALADTLRYWPKAPRLIVGMLATKDAAGYLAPLAQIADRIEVVDVPGAGKPMPAALLVEAAHSVGLAATPHTSLAAAVDAVLQETDEGPLLIAGTLHLAGHVLQSHA